MKHIFTGLSPNMLKGDAKIALKFLFLPWHWPSLRSGEAPRNVEDILRRYFGVSYAVTCDSGRSALQLALTALGIARGDEVLLQGYTCVVVTNAIRFAGGVPVYVDVRADANMDPEDVRKKITKKSKALIIQHTFGKTADLDALLRLANEHNLKVIEDCAHAFGTIFRGRKVGTFGDAAMISFGSEKALSCGRGGAVITNNRETGEKLVELQGRLSHPPMRIVLQHVAHFPWFTVGRAAYGFFGFGKALLRLGKLLHIVHRIIYPQEKRGEPMRGFPALLPNSLAAILLNQLQHIDTVNTHRITIGRIYEKELGLQLGIGDAYIPLRFPLSIERPDALLKRSKRLGILLGDWYESVVAPADSDPRAAQYAHGSCPVAEILSRESVNLPTDIHIGEDDALRIASVVKGA